MPTTTELTEKYIAVHPSIKDSLSKGIINYSKLSRLIAKELGIEKNSSMEAILIACRRYAAKIKKDKVQEDKILSVLKKSELEIKNKIVTIIIDKKLYIENLLDIEKEIRKKADMFYAIEGTNVFTIIVNEKYLTELKELYLYSNQLTEIDFSFSNLLNLENKNHQVLIKDLTKQHEQLLVKSILSDKKRTEPYVL